MGKTTPHSRAKQSRIVDLMKGLATDVGPKATAVDGVQIYRAVVPSPRGPLVYKPGLIFVGQGKKRVYVGNREVTYDASNYLVLSVPLPVECEFQCSPKEPILALLVDVTPGLVGEVLLDMDESLPPERSVPPALHSNPLDERMEGTLIRLLEVLYSPRDSKVLGRQIVREIVYLVLNGERESGLSLLAKRADRFDEMARVLREIQNDLSRDYTVEALAQMAHMSVTSFHQAFKQMTSTSPVQYIKRVRLDAARLMMLHEGHTASSAAHEVGYKSVSQFSREFKRHFGATPSEEANKQRARLGG